ncbi:DUF4097 family beta strand repeat-containing protein [Ureibacillus manganicus]|uniref:DUF4097 domain-containing protein n=1 Tax=Ureibacillus manganicus DSM 26584 TaxID=1384049 RepID=A0A0A3I1T2_9BACL|nr:DUF4097 family beta strand repeat-containing protein [Ureibacillus manganicus]KGR78679.1 hypothetical protein CD29_09890 [Ureibacillus manganicus DSM 26584]
MTEEKFYIQLEQGLSSLSEDEKKDIIRDFREHFASARAEGKTDVEIIEALGPVDLLADELLEAYAEPPTETTVDMEPINVPTFRNVDIVSDSADLTIIPSKDDKPYINVRDKDGKTTTKMDVVNDTLKIRISRENAVKKFFFIQINVNFSSDVHVIIQLPQKLYEQIMIKNDNGKIQMAEQQAKSMYLETDNGKIILKSLLASKMKAETDNGRIEIEKCNVTNGVFSTDNGRIAAKNSKAEKFEFSTDNGRIELNEVLGEIHATTDNGRIEGYIPTITKPIVFKSDNGSLTLKTDEKIENATLTAKSDFGRISVYGEKGKSFVFGEGNIPIRLKTDSGRITVITASMQEV